MRYLAITVGGQDINPPGGVPEGGFSQGGAGQSIITLVITALIVVGIVAAFAFLIWGGLQWTSSGGDKQKIQQARLKITFAVVGLVVIFLSFFIISYVLEFLNLSPTAVFLGS